MAYLSHALGLTLVRQNKPTEALSYLQSAAEAPEATPRFALVYALALDGVGQRDQAIETLRSATVRFGSQPAIEQLLAEWQKL